jgi:hypothetical protein
MNIKYPKVYITYMKMNSPPMGLLKWMYIGLFEEKMFKKKFSVLE